MRHFIESNDLLGQPSLLRKRLRDDGYLFLRNILPTAEVLHVQRRILEYCQDAGWLRPGSDLMEGLTDHPPILEGEPAWHSVYAQVQALEAFHRLKLYDTVHRIMEDLFQEPVFALPMTIARIAFPRDNERGTQPHQDWLYVGGSTEIISCWAPLGDIPEAVGGLRILKGSHKAGFLAPRPAPGPGGNTVWVDPSLEWLQSDYRTGDLLLFKSLTVHAAADNHTPDVLRLSMDFRYAGESHTITDAWLKPHFHWLGDPFSWEVLDKEWRDSPTARYWERLPNLKVKPHERFGRG
ncbi:MAG: phytanoyl-CoA dioxygenase family protein [Candidatus Latescibacteria bacterium]|nr:phytanoyl-CoA dioxygenase family protein [Candidatus Latescibacterota bacterium]